MTFYNYIKEKTASYGHQCSQCGGNDGYFALNGKCNICQTPMIKYGKEVRLRFCLEVFLEYIDHYCKPSSIFEKKDVRELLERILAGSKDNNPKINPEEITQMQTYFKSGYKLEELKGNYIITLNAHQTGMFWHHEPHETGWDLDGFTGAVFAIQFLTAVNFQ